MSPARTEVLGRRQSKLEKVGRSSPEPSCGPLPAFVIGGQARLRCRSGITFTMGWGAKPGSLVVTMIARLGPMAPLPFV